MFDLKSGWEARGQPRYGVHLQTANLFVTALREQLSADHPIRRFLTPFTSYGLMLQMGLFLTSQSPIGWRMKRTGNNKQPWYCLVNYLLDQFS